MSTARDEACDHFAAEATGVTEAIRLRDERWEFRTAFSCPSCGARFIEAHIQTLPTTPWPPEGHFDDDQ
jgi:hypothetical protein